MDLATVDELLTTTRSVRRRLDLTRPVPPDLLAECLELALQAPCGSNLQQWRWILVYDEDRKRALAELYRAGFGTNRTADTDQASPLQVSARHLAENMENVPVLVVPCIAPTTSPAGWGSSIFPAIWSLMLALRSRGLGSCMTTGHLYRKEVAAKLLGIPAEAHQACLLPVAYFTGDGFRPARRRPVDEVVSVDSWSGPTPAEYAATGAAEQGGP
jgi:nitroreductase